MGKVKLSIVVMHSVTKSFLPAYLPLFIFLLGGALSLASCNISKTPTEKEKMEIALSDIKESLEKRSEDIEAFYKDGRAKQLAEKYAAFADSFPDDLHAAEYLFRAAQEYEGGLGEVKKALELLELLQSRYPTHELIPNVLFYKAFIYENSLGEFGQARDHYEKLIMEYPGNEFAIQAKAAKELIGLSPEEVTKLFEEKQKN
jgi:tetratricopeptide (TPR) repeat protein